MHHGIFVSNQIEPGSLAAGNSGVQCFTSFLACHPNLLFESIMKFAEHQKGALQSSQLFKLMTDCNENKHGESVLIFIFFVRGYCLFCHPIHFISSLAAPSLTAIMPTVIIYPLLFGAKRVNPVLGNWCASAIPTPLSIPATEKTIKHHRL